MKPINGYGDIIEIDTKNYSDIKNWIGESVSFCTPSLYV